MQRRQRALGLLAMGLTLACGAPKGTTTAPGTGAEAADTPVATPHPPVWRAEHLATTPLSAIWGSGRGDVYAVGLAGTILHSANGETWSAQTSGVSVPLEALWGSGNEDIYAVGYNGTILHSVDGG